MAKQHGHCLTLNSINSDCDLFPVWSEKLKFAKSNMEWWTSKCAIRLLDAYDVHASAQCRMVDAEDTWDPREKINHIKIVSFLLFVFHLY